MSKALPTAFSIKNPVRSCAKGSKELINTFCLSFGINADAAVFLRGGGGLTGGGGFMDVAGFGGNAATPLGIGLFEVEGTGFGGKGVGPVGRAGSVTGGTGLFVGTSSSVGRIVAGVGTTRAL